MFVNIATLRPKPEDIEAFLAAARENSDSSTRNEPGCLRFDIVRDQSDRGRFIFVDVYEDDKAFAAHKETPHFQKMVATAGKMFAETPTETLCDGVWPPDDRWR